METIRLGYLKLGVMKQLSFLRSGWGGGGGGGGQTFLPSPGEELHFQNLKRVNSTSSLAKATSTSDFIIFFSKMKATLQRLNSF